MPQRYLERSVVTRAGDTATAGLKGGTTITGTILGPTGQYDSPFAGHASEASTTHTVGRRGFAVLSRLLREKSVWCGEFVLDGSTGSTVSARATCGDRRR